MIISFPCIFKLHDKKIGDKLKAIFAVMNTTQAVVKTKPEENSGLYGIWTQDLCDTGAVLLYLIFTTAKITS